jgi:hypothetical protein
MNANVSKIYNASKMNENTLTAVIRELNMVLREQKDKIKDLVDKNDATFNVFEVIYI